MASQIKENTSFVLNVVKLASIVIACIAAVTFFIYETQGLPPRVSKLETDLSKTNQKISEMQTEMSKSSVKQDIMLEDLKIIKMHLLHNN
jgi:hypothetical protein